MSRLLQLALPITRLLLLTCCLAFAPSVVTAAPCTVPDDGSGTVFLPPDGCGYLSPADVHLIIDGLPPGTTIKVAAQHDRFFNKTTVPGGSLGGDKENFGSNLHITLTGTGTLAAYSRTLVMATQCEVHTGPRIPGTSPQSFDTDMFGISGQLPIGDPDFDLLRITAGTGFSMPSPGHTTLTQLPSGNWNIDSFFDIEYRIDFIGHSPGPLAGHSGSTTATIRMNTGQPASPPCTVLGNGTGTVDLPPQGCPYLSPADVHQIIAGLPAGTTIRLGAQHQDFFNVTHTPGGSLGGEVEQFQSILQLTLNGTGSLSSLHRTLSMQAQCVTHTAPRPPGQVQSFDTDMFGIQGQLPIGDPDFDLLRITAGTGFNMPSPGHTTLVKQSGTPGWTVDSFFDIEYRIDFIGHSPGPLSGRSGSTTGTIRMQTGDGSGLASVPGGVRPGGKIQLSNRPNPFNKGTTIEYRLPSTAQVKLTAYDAAGKLVRTFIDETMPAGPHAMFWDGRSDAGNKLNSGIYFIKIAVNGKDAGSQRTTIIK